MNIDDEMIESLAKQLDQHHGNLPTRPEPICSPPIKLFFMEDVWRPRKVEVDGWSFHHDLQYYQPSSNPVLLCNTTLW